MDNTCITVKFHFNAGNDPPTCFCTFDFLVGAFLKIMSLKEIDTDPDHSLLFIG